MKLPDEDRTLDQNDKMWPMLRDIAKQVKWRVNGYFDLISPEDWKDILSAGFVGEVRLADGIDGGLVLLGARTHKFKKERMSQFIEYIYAFGANHEPPVVWSDDIQKP